MGQAVFNFCNKTQLNKGKLHAKAQGQYAFEGDKQMQSLSQESTYLRGKSCNSAW